MPDKINYNDLINNNIESKGYIPYYDSVPKNILITGANGFIGKNLVNYLRSMNTSYILHIPSKIEMNCIHIDEMYKFFFGKEIDTVIHLAGKVGGIKSNHDNQADFYYENIMMGTNIFEICKNYNIKKLVTLAAGCGYPLNIEPPFKEEDIWMGRADSNSWPYSSAKKMLIVQAEAYKNQYNLNSTILLPANVYGPHDNFDSYSSHVVPALIAKIVKHKIKDIKEIPMWGSGIASREFLYVDDIVRAIVSSIECNEIGPFNVGTGKETTINELFYLICKILNFDAKPIYENDMMDGQNRRFYDMTKFEKQFGYIPSTPLEEGLKKTIEWYIDNYDK